MKSKLAASLGAVCAVAFAFCIPATWETRSCRSPSPMITRCAARRRRTVSISTTHQVSANSATPPATSAMMPTVSVIEVANGTGTS